jgi:hypothetical protein
MRRGLASKATTALAIVLVEIGKKGRNYESTASKMFAQ